MRVVDYTREDSVGLTVVIPIYNEADSINNLYEELKSSLDGLGFSWEILFVDDGSTDSSFDELCNVREQDGRVGIVQFRRNFGQTAALSAGFDYSHGEVIVTLDGDLQNDPKDIRKILAKLDEGYDIVSGWRHSRKDSWLSRKLPSKIANRLISRLTGVRLHDYGCTLKAYRREVIKNLRLYGELHRFIPALANERGARVAEVKVNHRPRRFGQSKYTLSRTTRVLLDLANVKFLLEYRGRPLQFFGKVGLVGLASGLALFGVAVFMKIWSRVDLSGNPLLSLSLFLFTAGIQLISIGLVGELVTRAYYETQGKPVYVVRSIVNPAHDGDPDGPQSQPLGVIEDI